jgi:transcriptional regulator with PAS, ATPase and Fis domain
MSNTAFQQATTGTPTGLSWEHPGFRKTVPTVDQIVGSSAAMQVVHNLIRKVTSIEASVLITGESGTGKELIARAIHNSGKRSMRPFVAVSCSAIPESLIESELFGHDKGAFTGSLATREGYFERAGDGTLFLDEIGELSLNIQVKLLRVLQQREFNRLGSNRPIPMRARLVLATHRDLSKMVADGEFRQDLFYRISVMDILAPALRDRAEDIPELAYHFLQKHSEVSGRPVDGICPQALALLQSYFWPGNIRELENVIQRALIVTDGSYLQADDFPDFIQCVGSSERQIHVQPNGSFERSLNEYRIKLANDAIQQYQGNKTLAARSLSISRAYLHRLIRPEGDRQYAARVESSTGTLSNSAVA